MLWLLMAMYGSDGEGTTLSESFYWLRTTTSSQSLHPRDASLAQDPTQIFRLTVDPAELLRLGVDGQLSVDPSDVEIASLDFGLLSRAEPMAVLRPASAEDIAWLVRAAYNSAGGFTVSARGHGHSINGQAQTSRE
ncbi:hypothetical protein GH714_015707 [Hevea brasiliensis]|uniref:FAD linked oxidase N-terminal domain-containing protein n=1 Tax=Hevea brasiliensis TaxID=3981 RepID=A0A6A6NHM7_HEVBR|nr:hypothetical protein GH714_015707 [Hevea brasiliensis]